MRDGFDHVFQALAHPDRRRILEIVRERPGIQIGELAEQFELSRVAVHKHVEVLGAADLLISERHGRVRRLYFNLVPIQRIYEHWTDEYSAAWAAGLTRFARKVEDNVGRRSKQRKSGL